MIDVIIPAYNSHETIIRTLSSIAMQINKEELQVTIVNDGGKNYKEIIKIFKPLLKIQEIGYKENKGPGYARQYGIDNTNGDFITFIDADDTFYEACSLSLLSNPIKNTNTKFVISSFIQIGPNCEQQIMNPNLVWIFGHIYRRNFLNQHNIRFTPTRSNEDVGFNTMCHLIAQNDMGEEGGKILSLPTYEWHYNKQSITRRGKNEYEFGICTPGYIYNLFNAYNVAQRENVPLKLIALPALETAFSCFVYYNVALAKEVPKETLEGIEEISRQFYYNYYKQIQEFISLDNYKRIYSNSINSKGNHLDGIIFKITLDDFIKLMFSKKPKNIEYLEIEKNVQTNIKKRI